MNDEIQVVATFHKKRVGKHIAMVEGPPPTVTERPKGRLPRITRYMALAIYYEDLIRQGHVHSYAEIALLGYVTRARVTQIMNLRLLAPDIQEHLLTIPTGSQLRFSIGLRELQFASTESSWERQRIIYKTLVASFETKRYQLPG